MMVDLLSPPIWRPENNVKNNLVDWLSEPNQNTVTQPWLFLMAHTRGLVPTTSRGDKFHSVNWPFLLQNLVAGANFLQLVPRIQTSLNSWGTSLRLVPQNALCELFVGQVLATSPFL